MPRLLRALGPALLATLVLGTTAAAATAAPGDPDTGFAAGGVYAADWQTTYPGAEDSHRVEVDSLGRVYLAATLEAAAGGGTPRKINVRRLTAQGQLDTSYGPGGTVTLPFPGDTRLGGLVIDAQDRAVIAGTNDEAGSFPGSPWRG